MTLGHGIDPRLRQQVVETANLAPSVHNTQPTRWHFHDDGSVWILTDPGRHLAIGDPTGRDAALSCGAALEGTILALADLGIGIAEINDFWLSKEPSPMPPYQAVARLELKGEAVVSPLSSVVQARYTYRGFFSEPASGELQSLAAWADERCDVTLVLGANDVEMLAELDDLASLGFFRNAAYRHELLSWMRLRQTHPAWAHDGLNRQALQMSVIEAFGAGIVLRSPVFKFMDRIGLAKALVSERAKTLSASGVALFHRPVSESPAATGRAFYQVWLEVTRLGFVAWPMAAIADDTVASADVHAQFRVPDGDRLVNLLRLGKAPNQARPVRARLPAAALFSSSE